MTDQGDDGCTEASECQSENEICGAFVARETSRDVFFDLIDHLRRTNHSSE